MKSKKLLSLLLILALCATLIAGCGNQTAQTQTSQAPTPEASTQVTPTPTPEEVEETTAPDGPDFETYTTITTNGIVDSPVAFNLLPDGYNTYETEHKGTDTVIHYTTDVYEDGVTYNKFARVYLPYGYDEKDTGKKYNVLYFQHGNGGSPNELFDRDMKSVHPMNLLNNMFDPDHQVMEPVIIVCPTYYLEYDESATATPGDNPAGDGRYEGIPANYYLEVLQDLIPAVESQFNVYCEEFSAEGIKATRDHRAWSGFSRGSMCTFYMFHNNLEYFRYFVPMSAPLAVPGASDGTSVEQAFDYLKEPIAANPELDFFLYATAGGKNDTVGDKNLAENMHEQATFFAKQTDVFSFGEDPSVNNFYFARTEFIHNTLVAPYSLAQAADVLFHIGD